MKIPIISIVGATAVGKTALSIQLANKYNAEIISIDSVQIYKKFDIGSAKIKEEEMEGVVHHLIDVLEPTQDFSVYDFQKVAREKIEDIHSRGKLPILIGGSGYYMNAVIYDYRFVEREENVKNISLEEMLAYLESNFPDTYAALDKHNERRVMNAYNNVISSGESTENNKTGSNVFCKYHPHVIVLDRPREILYDRINKRVDIMLKEGLVEEVREIANEYGRELQAMSSIGYKEVLNYLDGQISQEKLAEDIAQNSRRYAKRQLTWFRNKLVDKHWYNLEETEYSKIEEDINEFLGSIFDENK
ncbi:MAG: tRNA (adenosine(37)-N6)-dimethylallyltransferase MiaA [Gemella sp.]|nr:tRNA (adenosine(37)-N6)-dimethylallyltransferase MiaA [Gemella sp.]